MQVRGNSSDQHRTDASSVKEDRSEYILRAGLTRFADESM